MQYVRRNWIEEHHKRHVFFVHFLLILGLAYTKTKVLDLDNICVNLL